MNEQERKTQASLPSCPNPTCPQAHVVRNGSHHLTEAGDKPCAALHAGAGQRCAP